jgi:putative oxidoreductase
MELKTMTTETNASHRPSLSGIGKLVDWANATIAAVATTSLTQLVLRLALATPFWKSGILKWDGNPPIFNGT